MLNTYDTNVCSSNLTIFLYFTNKHKILPNSNIIVLDNQHVNTGYTVDCVKKSEIVIYRKEEWFKVFLHETMHNFSFDFSSMNLHNFNNQMNSLVPIHIEFNVFESYCEMWARIINTMFCGYNSLNSSLDIVNETNEKTDFNSLFNTFYLYSETLLQIERVFTFYQCNKVLKFMGLTYENLYNNDETSIMLRKQLYRENTNVFSYYILTALFFNNYIDFIKWCYYNNMTRIDNHTNNLNKSIKFNRTSENLNQYFSLIKHKYKDKSFIKKLNDIQMILNKNKNKNDFSRLNHSLRMTLFELNVD
jgi:hypothetical protein